MSFLKNKKEEPENDLKQAKDEMEKLVDSTVRGIEEADKEAVEQIDEEFLAEVKAQEEEFKKIIPGFDLSMEIDKNPMFAVMLSFKEPIEKIYGYFHPEYVFEKCEQEILERIKARNIRPMHVEQRGKSSGYDVNNLSAKDMEEIGRRVRRGERVEL